MPERPLVDVVGAIDLHMHAAPSYSHSRPYDDDVTARHALEHGMAALLLNNAGRPVKAIRSMTIDPPQRLLNIS